MFVAWREIFWRFDRLAEHGIESVDEDDAVAKIDQAAISARIDPLGIVDQEDHDRG